MSRWFSLPRPFLAALATVFAAAAVLYASVWMYVERYPGPRVKLGFNKLHNEQYDESAHSIKVGDVVQGSPAEQAGLRAGDHIIGSTGGGSVLPLPTMRLMAAGSPATLSTSLSNATATHGLLCCMGSSVLQQRVQHQRDLPRLRPWK
jgi:hypothetical protein